MSNWSVYSPCVWQQFSSRPSLRLNICRSRGVACKYKQEQQQQHWTGSWLQSPKVWFPILTRVFFSQSVPCCYGKLLCFALPVKRGKHFKKKQQQFILLARPRGCQNSNCLRVKKSASTSGPPKPPRTVWVQLSYPLSEKLPKVTGSESRAYYKIWLRCYQLCFWTQPSFFARKQTGFGFLCGRTTR